MWRKERPGNHPSNAPRPVERMGIEARAQTPASNSAEVSETTESHGPLRAYRVTGRVQGVGFRAWTKARADELGLFGSVRNCADGSVLVLATGPTQALERFARLLATGPPAAKVEKVERVAPPPNAVPQGVFEVIH